MPTTEEAHARLAGIPDLTVSADAPLAPHTRFGIGGPADLYAETRSAEAFIAALTAARESGRDPLRHAQLLVADFKVRERPVQRPCVAEYLFEIQHDRGRAAGRVAGLAVSQATVRGRMCRDGEALAIPPKSRS